MEALRLGRDFRRRLTDGFFPDRGLSDPNTIDTLTDIPALSITTVLVLPVPENCVLMSSSSAFVVGEVAPGGQTGGATPVIVARREGNAAPTLVFNANPFGALTLLVANVINTGPTGWAIVVAQQAGAIDQKAAGRWLVITAKIP